MSDIRKPSLQEKFDAEFDAFLRANDSHLAALYRKLPHPEPDAALDARVRAQALRALRDGSDATTQAHSTTHARRLRARRWLPAFGAAAALVLVAGLAWRLMPPAAPTREAASVADTAAPSVAQSERAASVPAPAAPVHAEAPPASGDAAMLYKHKLHRTGAANPDSPAAADKAGAEAKPAANGMVAAVPKMAAPPAAIPPPGIAEPSAYPPRVAELPRAKSAQPPAAAAEAEPARRESVAAAAPAPPPRETASAERAASTPTFADRAAPAGSPVVVRPDPSAPARYHWEIVDDATAAPARGIYPPDTPPLRAWVEIVRALLRDGHGKEAKQALADLRRSHPDFSVPADLRGLE